MSQFDEDDDDNGEIDFDGNGSINQIRKALRQAEKHNKKLEDELSSFRTDNRKRALQDALRERNLNPKIAAFVPSEILPDAVGGWLDDNADVFGRSADMQSENVPTPEDSGFPEPEGAATFNEMASRGKPPTGDAGDLAQLIAGAKSKEDLDKIIFGKTQF